MDTTGSQPRCEKPTSRVVDVLSVLGVSSLWTLLAAVFLAMLVLLACVLAVGDRLASLHPLCAAVLYIAGTVLFVAGVAVPIVRVLRRPVYALADLVDDVGRPHHARCRRFVAALLSNPELSCEQRASLRACLDGSPSEARLVADQFEQIVVPRLDALIRTAATSAFACTAVSQSSVVDGATVLSINMNLVRALVEECGFRPGKLALARLYARVLGCALVASGLEELDADEVLSNMLGGGALGAVSGVVAASAAQGLANAFLVLRIGSIAKGHLRYGIHASRDDLRRASYAEALAIMRQGDFTGTLLSLLKKTASSFASAAVAGVREAANTAGRTVKDTVLKAASLPITFMQGERERP